MASSAVLGDVTSLTIVKLPLPDDTYTEVLLGGIGSQIHAFSLPDCRHLFSTTALPNAARCHGISACWLPHPTATSPVVPLTTWVAVHGDRHVSIFTLSPSSSPSITGHVNNPTALIPLTALPRLSSWTMAVNLSCFPGESSAALLTVGLSDNSVEFYKVESSSGDGGGGGSSICLPVLLRRVECADRCLLYSMDLFLPHSATSTSNSPLSGEIIERKKSIEKVEQPCMMFVAAGTIFLDVIVWAAAFTPSSVTTSKTTTTTTTTTTASAVLYRLKGHEGSVHTVKWGPLGLTLASGSDDRTVRLWDIPSTTSTASNTTKIAGNLQSTLSSPLTVGGDDVGEKKEEEEQLQEEVLLRPRRVLYGHSARLWASCFSSNEGVVVSGSEDGTCRLWDAESGDCLATLKAHRFRGVWHCQLYGSILFTGGADGAIKAWSLWDCLEPPRIHRLLAEGSTTTTTTSCSTKRKNASAFSKYHSWCPWTRTILQGTLPDPLTTSVGHVINVVLPSSNLTGSGADEINKSAPLPVKFDSSREWVRCLALSKNHSTLFVATNRGLIHEVQLPTTSSSSTFEERKEERWTTIYKSSRNRPLMSLNIIEIDENGVQQLGACDITGYAVVLRSQQHEEESPTAVVSQKWSCCEWQPYEAPIAAIAVHFHPEMGLETAFTTSLKGQLTLWQLPKVAPLVASTQGNEENVAVRLADAPHDFKHCTLSVITTISALPVVFCTDDNVSVSGDTDSSQSSGSFAPVLPTSSPSCTETETIENGRKASKHECSSTYWLIAAGTSCGRVVLWRLDLFLPNNSTQTSSSSSTIFTLLATVENVHFGSSVRGITLQSTSSLSSSSEEKQRFLVESEGGNGTIIHFEVESSNGKLIYVGEEKFDALLIVAGRRGGSRRKNNKTSSSSSSPITYGFQTTNFLVWDEAAEAEVCSVHCGNWRRPWTANVISGSDLTFCIDLGSENIHIYARRPFPVPHLHQKHLIAASSSLSSSNEEKERGTKGDDGGNGNGLCEIKSSFPALPFALMSPGHGTEINALKLLSVDSSSSSGSIVCITAGEDSTIRQAVMTMMEDSTTKSSETEENGGTFTTARLRNCGLVGDHAGGTSVRAMALAVLPDSSSRGNRYLMVSGGSKQVLMAWMLTTRDDNTPPPPLRSGAGGGGIGSEQKTMLHSELLSAHVSLGTVSKKSVSRDTIPLSVELRYMAVSVLIHDGCAFILAAAANSTIDVFALPLERDANGGDSANKHDSLCQTWQKIAALKHHTSPVLSLQSLCLSENTHSPSSSAMGTTTTSSSSSGADDFPQYVAFSAATDGSIAVWNLSACIQSFFLDRRSSSSGSTPAGAMHQEDHVPPAAAAAAVLSPVIVLSGVHQSGINGMSAVEIQIRKDSKLVPAGDSLADDAATLPSSSVDAAAAAAAAEFDGNSVMVATVGDDQALVATLLQFSSSGNLLKAEMNGTTATATNDDDDDAIFGCALLGQERELNAHSSAARDVWTDGDVIFSVGLDQRIRRWKLKCGILHVHDNDGDRVQIEIEETGCEVVQVLEPASVDVLRGVKEESENNGGDGGNLVRSTTRVVVAGRGLHVMEWI